jgi:hypothetical protein
MTVIPASGEACPPCALQGRAMPAITRRHSPTTAPRRASWDDGMCGAPRRGDRNPIRQIVGHVWRASPPGCQSGCRMVHTWPTPRCEGPQGTWMPSPLSVRGLSGHGAPRRGERSYTLRRCICGSRRASRVCQQRDSQHAAPGGKIMRRRAASVAVGDGKRPSERSSLEPCRRRAVPWSLPVSGARSREGRFSRRLASSSMQGGPS